jgi:hypothetical protein
MKSMMIEAKTAKTGSSRTNIRLCKVGSKQKRSFHAGIAISGAKNAIFAPF